MKMSVPDELKDQGVDRVELMISLPPDWEVAGEDEAWYWPIRVLKLIGRIPADLDDWIGLHHTVGNDEPPRPFAEGVKFCASFLTLPRAFGEESWTCELPGGELVRYYQLFPLYESELGFILSRSGREFESLLLSRNTSLVVDVNRKNLVLN